MFNAGDAASSGAANVRRYLCDEAIRLARILSELVPHEAEAASLLALLLLHDSRRKSRANDNGEYVPLEAQERQRWDHIKITEGVAILAQLDAKHADAGSYQLQAKISAEHAKAYTFTTTDWLVIARCYDQLYQLNPTPVVRLNGAVAIANAHCPELGLKVLRPIDDAKTLEHYQPYHAARAELLRRSGALQQAAQAYQTALALTTNTTEYNFLSDRLAAVNTELSER